MAELNKLLILEEAVILNLAGNPNFVQEFPFLNGVIASAAAKSGGCNRCGRPAAQRINALNGVKQAFLTMSPEKKQRLKQLLNSEKVRVRLLSGGKVLEYTF